jgi:hypothetical protein
MTVRWGEMEFRQWSVWVTRPHVTQRSSSLSLFREGSSASRFRDNGPLRGMLLFWSVCVYVCVYTRRKHRLWAEITRFPGGIKTTQSWRRWHEWGGTSEHTRRHYQPESTVEHQRDGDRLCYMSPQTLHRLWGHRLEGQFALSYSE